MLFGTFTNMTEVYDKVYSAEPPLPFWKGSRSGDPAAFQGYMPT
jgi:hypothetical protein